MKHAIVFISRPDDVSLRPPEIERAWRDTENIILSTLEQAKHGKQLGEGAWLIPLGDGAAGLETIQKISSAAQQHRCPCKVLLVEGELDWLS
jgi:hypothetical protein